MVRAEPGRRAPAVAALAGVVVLALRHAAPSTFVAGGPLMAGSPTVPRGEAVPRTQMQASTKDRTRLHGGGRLPIRVTRNPVLAYSITEEKADNPEPAGPVLRRMYDMYESDFNKMAAMRDRYWRPGYRKKRWVADYNMRQGRRMKESRIRRQYETDWQEWMSTVGRKQGLTDPIIFNGPPLASELDEELDKMTDPKEFRKNLPSQEEWKTAYKPPTGRERIPEDMEPGKFNTDGPDSIFNIWKRPLHKHPYDIGKRGKIGPVTRGIVM